MKRIRWTALAVAAVLSGGVLRAGHAKCLLAEEDFEKSADLKNWYLELENKKTTAAIKNGKFEWKCSGGKNTGGLVIWYKQSFKGDIEIRYDRTIFKDGRVADMNQFWMAREKDNKTPVKFGRNGDFGSYDNMCLYYAGFGVWNNTKSRYRRYNGRTPRPKPVESKFKISAKTFAIRIVVEGGRSRVYAGNTKVFDVTDKNPYTWGHFGFRALGTHETIDNFRVYSLDDSCTEPADTSEPTSILPYPARDRAWDRGRTAVPSIRAIPGAPAVRLPGHIDLRGRSAAGRSVGGGIYLFPPQ